MVFYVIYFTLVLTILIHFPDSSSDSFIAYQFLFGIFFGTWLSSNVAAMQANMDVVVKEDVNWVVCCIQKVQQIFFFYFMLYRPCYKFATNTPT